MPMNYLDLTGPKTKPGSIHNFVNYAKVPVEVVLEEAEAFIYSRLRVREMRASAVVSLAIGASTSALPDGYLETITMFDREGWNLMPDGFVSEDLLLRLRTYTNGVLDSGTPMKLAVYDEMFNFDCKADAARTLDHIFYKTPAALSASNKTNFLTRRYPYIVRIGCLAGAASYMKDDAEETKQLTKLTALCDAANAESDLGKAV